ncbi:putative coagulation factor 5/8 domain-containing protein [Erwinia phage vB_EamP_Frozen]|uniref:Coagulation factor 5/8 domain-containing protein n=2 Tax=Johnsonvirus frozen TaxID=1982578 RepID=A0A191ZCV0_9CAUD|nr:hydrolase [Erwinia phage vB_EamP_Frozen]ANJ65214.1 putative coagulation factor 5/8 domain-containing protein [Erwinia phage vB_EamP_Frozen]ANJ65389.1 putative coagulation factor 5/8 domain-containing protein [Erwinia phage vB_EamP_Gutmeister]
MPNEYRDISDFQLSDQYSSRVIQKNPYRIPFKGSLVPDSLTFGSVLVGKQGRSMNATLINEGFRDLPIKDIRVTSDFTMTTDCPIGGTLAEGKTCNITVNFNPAATGSRQGGIYVDTGDSRGEEFIVLSGFGVPSNVGNLALSVENIDFGYVPLGSSETQQVTLTNTGTQTLTISALDMTKDFTVTTSSGLPVQLVANAAVVLNIVYTPSAAEKKSGTLTIQHDGIGAYFLPLSGSAVQVTAP